MIRAVMLTLASLIACGPASAADMRAALGEVENMLMAGVEDCRQGRFEDAEVKFSDAYFAAFETGGLETEIRQRISGKRAFQLERRFHGLRRMALEKAAVAVVEAEARSLVMEIEKDVSQLERPNRIGAVWVYLAFIGVAALSAIPLVRHLSERKRQTSKEG